MPYTEINVTMELVSSSVVAVLFFSQFVKKHKTRQDWYFLCMLGIHMICTLSDAVNWAFDTRPGTVFRLATVTGNFLSYFMSALAYIPFILYVMEAAAQKRKVNYHIFRTACFISVLMALLSVLNLFNGMLYTIDENNIFCWGRWDSFFNFLVFLQLLLAFLQILQCRNALERRDLAAFVTYEILPVVTIMISIFQTDITLVYPATMLSLLLLYVNVQQGQENRLARKEVELAESHTAVMLSQIQPHFLYNALTAVEHLCAVDPPEAERAVADFSRYLRGNMKALTQRQPVPFTEELRHIRCYLNLEKLRFGDRLRISIKTGPVDFFVPVLSVQPIVENAVKHGVCCRKTGGTVVLSTEEKPEYWLITIADDGVGFNPADTAFCGKEHIGIANVKDRLASMSGGSLEIQSSPGKGTTVKIQIPREVART